MIHTTPEGDEEVALKTLDRLCADGIVEACDAGRELLWLCTAVDKAGDRQAWAGACDVLAAAGRVFPPNADTSQWVEVPLPAYLRGCHVVQAERTCDFGGNTYLEPVQGPLCVFDPAGCPTTEDRIIDLDEPSSDTRCVPTTLPAVQPGAVHCFERNGWWFSWPGRKQSSARVTWHELRGMDAVGAWIGDTGGPVLTIEGTGEHPVLRIGSTRAWLGPVESSSTSSAPRTLKLSKPGSIE
jgi:hypothetical protein